MSLNSNDDRNLERLLALKKLFDLDGGATLDTILQALTMRSDDAMSAIASGDPKKRATAVAYLERLQQTKGAGADAIATEAA
jgi:hypothetical protein